MFKVGDRVRCVDAEGREEFLIEGVHYEVASTNGESVSLIGLPESHASCRFVLINDGEQQPAATQPATDEKPPFKKGDRVRCIDDRYFEEGKQGVVKKGEVYTVDNYTTWAGVTIGKWCYNKNRFVLADEPQPAAETVQYETGAVRSADAESVRYDLISPIALERWAKTCHEGALKHGDYNWEKGLSINVMINHGMRHLFKYLAGDRSEDHLGHALWNIAGAIHSEELWPHLNHNLRGPNCTPPTEAVEA